ncbi:MAG: c-type cytochrome biogenesis protein CcmI [Rhodobacteraceae bacterium]|nr:c-type cytochrome biogenesis protein CcmI [Paracoccaceae bacterium]
MIFWIYAAVITITILGWMLLPLLRGRNASGERRSSYDMQVFRDQLTELETDLTRGVLSESEAGRSRAEVSRRLLAAADAEQTESATINAPRTASMLIATVIVGITAIGGLALYRDIGAPGAQDFPLIDNLAWQAEIANNRAAQEAARPSQSEAEAVNAERVAAMANGDLPSIDEGLESQNTLVTELQTTLINRPDDLVGHQMLARNLASLGRFTEARLAQDTVIRLLGDSATGVDHITHAEIMINAADGYVSPAAFRALEMALEKDPSNPRGRFFAGYTANQYGYPEQAYQLWAGLLEEGPEDAPWIPSIRSQIGAVAAAAGITRPEQQNGPSADDIAAAAEMSEDERMELIRNMVAGLANRLANEGGPAEEWSRLIGAYMVLGETDKAAEIWSEAQEVFTGSDLAMLRQAAVAAGVENQ